MRIMATELTLISASNVYKDVALLSTITTADVSNRAARSASLAHFPCMIRLCESGFHIPSVRQTATGLNRMSLIS